MRTAEILLVEDSPSLAAVYQVYLQKDQHRVTVVGSGREALAFIEARVPEVVLLDLQLPDIAGMEVLKQIHAQGLDCSVVIITAHGSVDIAVEAMRYGATDFISKPFDAARLHVTLDNVLEKRQLSQMVEGYQKTFDRDHFHRFIGRSLAMQAVFRIIESAAPSKATVFITGESGTGKELCAEAIHRESPRRDKQLVALNCAAIPRDLMESEVFGHVKGAFTGAAARRDGAASRANGGTLFLDEICEMDIELQSKLLRFIQTGTFQRVGDNKPEEVDVRFVCATNRNPLAEVKAGRFREDLYYRLNVIPIQLPPLRERGDDILLIAVELLRRIAREEGKGFNDLSPEVAERFSSYPWLGNVRELENTIRNIVVLNQGERVMPDMIPVHMSNSQSLQEQERVALPADDFEQAVTPVSPVQKPSRQNQPIRPLWLEEKEIIERAVDLCDGNIPRAAAMLEISASTIYRKRQGWDEQLQRTSG
jgi:two-component system repressor protein LuxO